MAWVEIADGWKVTETRTGATATRVFHSDPVAGISLPSLYQQHPSTSLQALYVASRDFSKINKSGVQKCVIQYAPYTDENPAPGANFDDLPRRWRIGGEFINIEAGAPFYWKSNGNLVNQNTFKRLINETYIITEMVDEMNPASPSGKHAAIINAAGHCNSSSWQGLGKGDWLYIGADIDQQFSASGSPSYRIEHNFASRIVPGASEGWQRIYNEVAGDWDQVSNQQVFNEDGQLYPFTSFSLIFSAIGA